MLPIAVIPHNDPQGLLFPHLQAITPILKQIFGRVIISISLPTQQSQPGQAAWLESDPFFLLLKHTRPLLVGEDFRALYTFAAAAVPQHTLLHLCYLDRVAYALQSEHRAQFTADLAALDAADTPLIFHRSPAAWQTHPRNYRDLEQIVTRTGEYLFGKTIDYAWCHLALQAGTLERIMPATTNPDISMVAEMALMLQDQAQTKEVDWLAWEDPFIFGREPDALRTEREQSPQETRKRLAYVIPMLEKLYQHRANQPG